MTDIAKHYTRVWGIYKRSDGRFDNGTVTLTPHTETDATLKAANTKSATLKNGKFSVRVLSSDNVGTGSWTGTTTYDIVVDLDSRGSQTYAEYSVVGDQVDFANEYSKGDTGATGPTGPTGATGPSGSTATKTELQAIVASITTIAELKTQIAAWAPKA